MFFSSFPDSHKIYLRQFTLAGGMVQDRPFREEHAVSIHKARKSDFTAPEAAIIIGMINDIDSPDDFKKEDLHSYNITVLGGNHTVSAFKSK